MVNISIDPPDFRFARLTSTCNKSIQIDETESIYELVSEGIFDTSVPDDDDSDNNDVEKPSKSIQLYCVPVFFYTIAIDKYTIQHFAYYQAISPGYMLDLQSPPPEKYTLHA
jgi:hypothetical protein